VCLCSDTPTPTPTHYALTNTLEHAQHTHAALAAEGKEAIAHLAHSNRSLCRYKMGDYDDALHDAEKTIAFKREWHKGWARKAAVSLPSPLSFFLIADDCVCCESTDELNVFSFLCHALLLCVLHVVTAADMYTYL